MKKPLPPRDIIWVDPTTGRPTDLFFEYLKDNDSRTLGQPISTTSPTNGQVMTFNSSTGLWTPGAN